MRKKSIGVLSLSALLAFGAFAPGVAAANLHGQNTEERVQIQIASVENAVSKEVLIEKVKELFPGMFDSVSNSDFQLRPSHRFPEDDESIIRHNLYFSKEVGGNYTHGDFEFIGEGLELQQFYYRPYDVEDALFPAKVSRSEAQEIADEFLKKLPSSSDYKLRNGNVNFYPGYQQTLTEPIRYNFSYQKHKDGVPISNQHVNIEVLGNGEIVNYNGPYRLYENMSFENVNLVKDKAEIQKQMEENFAVDLQYLVDFDYRTQEASVRLVYFPIPHVQGVHGITGDWLVQSDFVETMPSNDKEVKFLVAEPLEVSGSPLSTSEARALVEELLNVDDIEGLELRVERVEETKNHRGQEVIRVDYMLERRNSGYGTSIELDKNTGEILQFHDLRREVLMDMGKIEESEAELSYDEALALAVDFAKEYAPSKLHHFAYPTIESSLNRENYYISFPRVKDGIVVSGQALSIGVNVDGTLSSFNVNFMEFDHWPLKEDVVSEAEVVTEFLDKLELELMFLNKDWNAKELQYYLVYTPNYGDHYLINAVTGKWEGYGQQQGNEESEKPVVENHWAEEELNFMIDAGIIKVDDVDAFSADASTTKGEALEVIMKSLTRFYDYYRGNEELSHSFENIPPSHSLYQVVERAVNLGILDKTKDEFAYEEVLTRQELAVWYIRALGLEEAAKHSSIFALDFKDADLVAEDRTGYVAVANALGILTESNGWFRPDQEVTFGQLAVSAFRLARQTYSDSRFNRY